VFVLAVGEMGDGSQGMGAPSRPKRAGDCLETLNMRLNTIITIELIHQTTTLCGFISMSSATALPQNTR